MHRSDLMKPEFSRQIFENYSSIKFHENRSSGVRFVPCGQIYVTNILVALRNFANAPKMTLQLHVRTSNTKFHAAGSLKNMDDFPLTSFKFTHTA
jgi:hypothetical protein